MCAKLVSKHARKKSSDWNPNISPAGWYAATYLLRFEFEDEDKRNLNRRCRAWKNMILVRGKTPEDAFTKAQQIARSESEDSGWRDARGIPGKLIFEGFTSFLPVYDELEDGCEIAWWDYPNRSVRTIRAMVKRKSQLQIFQRTLRNG